MEQVTMEQVPWVDIMPNYIDNTELLEYWRMSNAYEVSHYKRLQWTADRYSNRHNIPSIKVYKAIETLTRQGI